LTGAAGYNRVPPVLDDPRGDRVDGAGAIMDGEGAGPIYFLLHVPKTAGMTVEGHILGSLPAECVWRPLSRRRWRREHGPRPQVPAHPERVRVAIGHHLRVSLEACFPGREIRRAVLLREPVSFYVSLYNWTMAVRQRRGEPTFGFRLFLKTVSRDMVSRFLLTHWFELKHWVLPLIPRRRRYAMLNAALRRFWFVGDYTDCDRLIATVGPKLGIAPTAQAQNTSTFWRRSARWTPLLEEEVPADLKASIVRDNPLDHALWRSWSGAGDNPGGVTPEPLAWTWDQDLALHELARPVFKLIAAVAARAGLDGHGQAGL